jgi:hypothetical protein
MKNNSKKNNTPLYLGLGIGAVGLIYLITRNKSVIPFTTTTNTTNTTTSTTPTTTIPTSTAPTTSTNTTATAPTVNTNTVTAPVTLTPDTPKADLIRILLAVFPNLDQNKLNASEQGYLLAWVIALQAGQGVFYYKNIRYYITNGNRA